MSLIFKSESIFQKFTHCVHKSSLGLFHFQSFYENIQNVDLRQLCSTLKYVKMEQHRSVHSIINDEFNRKVISSLSRNIFLKEINEINPSNRLLWKYFYFQYRDFSKSIIKKKEKLKSKNKFLSQNDVGSSEEIKVNLKNLNGQLDKILEAYKVSLSKIKSGTISTTILDDIKINWENGQTKLINVAQVSVKNPKQLSVTVFDPSMIDIVCSTISQAGLNLNPIIEGGQIMIPVAKQTKESRFENLRKAREIKEKTKVSVNAVRRNFIEQARKYKKTSELSEDKYFTVIEDIERVIQITQNEVNTLLELREKEISKN